MPPRNSPISRDTFAKPLPRGMTNALSAAEWRARLWSKISIIPGGYWKWTGATNAQHRPVIKLGHRLIYVARAVFELEGLPLEQGMQVRRRDSCTHGALCVAPVCHYGKMPKHYNHRPTAQEIAALEPDPVVLDAKDFEQQQRDAEQLQNDLEQHHKQQQTEHYERQDRRRAWRKEWALSHELHDLLERGPSSDIVEYEFQQWAGRKEEEFWLTQIREEADAMTETVEIGGFTFEFIRG